MQTPLGGGKRSEFAAPQFCVRLGLALEKQAAATLGTSEASRQPAADTSADGSGLAVGTRCLSVGLLPASRHPAENRWLVPAAAVIPGNTKAGAWQRCNDFTVRMQAMELRWSVSVSRSRQRQSGQRLGWGLTWPLCPSAPLPQAWMCC